MSNKIKIGEWIDNREHPLWELTDENTVYEDVLVRFRRSGSYVKSFLAGMYYPRYEQMTCLNGTILLSRCNGEWGLRKHKNVKCKGHKKECFEFVSKVEIIAYMLIPECEVGRND